MKIQLTDAIKHPLLWRGLGGLLAFFLLASCEKEIAIDYHTTQPYYVAEVELTPEMATARITTTCDVTCTSNNCIYIDNATVTLRMEGTNWIDTLPSIGLGCYRLDYYAYEGKEYCIDVIIDGRHHTSTSTMHSMPQIISFDFVWQDVLTERMLLGDLHLQDNPDQINYYFMHLYRNGLGYRWAVIDDSSNPGGDLQQLFTCTTERDMDKGIDSDILRDGDRLRLEVRSIDQRAFDYLVSLQLMSGTGTNPIANFTGDLLGYFSAFQQVTLEHVFSRDSCKEVKE